MSVKEAEAALAQVHTFTPQWGQMFYALRQAQKDEQARCEHVSVSWNQQMRKWQCDGCGLVFEKP